MANIRETDAIVQVVRVFSDSNVQHVATNINPADDIATINTELVLADLQTVDNRLAKVGKDSKQQDMASALRQAREVLDNGFTLYGSGVGVELLRELHLLTVKPFIYVFNVDESDLQNHSLRSEMQILVAPAEAVFICAKIEAELSELDSADAAELLNELGQSESGLTGLVKAGQRTLGLQSFLTGGPKEVRAWTIPEGTKAPQAAGVIHTDFEKGFIKAEVVSYSDLVGAGSLTAARSAGKARLEGKDYIMKPDDVVEFRVNT